MPMFEGKDYTAVPYRSCHYCIRHQEKSGLSAPACAEGEWSCGRVGVNGFIGFLNIMWVHLPDYVASVIEGEI